ncbi:MAG: uroporphyrinogen-III C-methyltransferase [Oscillospiraceae bacterium]
MTKKGRVVLVGAGPGDAGLLTLNAIDEISRAEVVVYDRLVSDSIMELIPQGAVKINVGKNVGHHPIPQHEINRILLDKALEGFNVVRLKGGDSFVFGRGGEELELLYENGVEFKVVPGITSALSAATYAGIPITHRDFCSSLHIITGHKKSDGALDIDYSSLVKLNGTLVFMMSVSSSGEIAQGLMNSGMDGTMPCAAVENGTRPNQRKLISTIEHIGEDILKNNIQSPAVILVGRVCTLSDKFDWFSKLPLKGVRILVTRPKTGSGRMLAALRSLGADAHAIPAIKTVPIDFHMPNFKTYSWLIFTSSAGVESFFSGFYGAGIDARSLHGAKVAAVGSETARVLKAHGIIADFVPAIYCGEALASEMAAQGLIGPDDKLLLIRGTLASRELNSVLEKENIPYDELTVYDTVDDISEEIDLSLFDLVTFTSASCIDALAKHAAHGTDFSKVKAICIGDQTAQKAREFGMRTLVSKTASIDSMIDLIKTTMR